MTGPAARTGEDGSSDHPRCAFAGSERCPAGVRIPEVTEVEAAVLMIRSRPECIHKLRGSSPTDFWDVATPCTCHR